MYSELDEVAESLFNAIKRDGVLAHSIELAKNNLRGLSLYVTQQMEGESASVIDGVTESLRELLLTEAN